MLDACVSVPKLGTPLSPELLAIAMARAERAPRISPADAAPLVAIFAQARTAPTAVTA